MKKKSISQEKEKQVHKTWILFSQNSEKPKILLGKRSKFYISSKVNENLGQFTKCNFSRKNKRPVKMKKERI